MSGDSKRVRLAARTTLTLFSRSPVCGVFWGTEMGWSLPGGGGRRRDFVAAGCCARGWPRPVCGTAGIIYDGVLGPCMRIRRGRPIECAAVVLSLRLHRLLPIDNSSLRVRVLEFGTRTQTACVPFTEQAHMLSRELERQRNRHRQGWTFPSVSPPGALASNIGSTLPFSRPQPQPFTLQQYSHPTVHS